jgi:hypothetical protein
MSSKPSLRDLVTESIDREKDREKAKAAFVEIGRRSDSSIGGIGGDTDSMIATTVDSVIATTSEVDSHQSHQPRKKDWRRGDRHRDTRKQVIFRLSPAKIIAVKQWCLDHDDVSMQDFLELAVDSMLSRTVDSTLSHDDVMKLYKTLPTIINLYRAYTGNKWNPNDDGAGHAFNDVDIRLIELGMCQTILNAQGRRIHSFKYFVPEIQLAMSAGLGEETLQIMHRHRKEQVKKFKQ